MASEYVNNRIHELFGSGALLCAESVVKVIAEAGGRESDEVVRAATGFCSGASRTCGQCGAVSGAVMGIGLYAGRAEPGEDHESCYAMVQEFLARFSEQYGSINCFELIGCDFTTVEGKERYKANDLKGECCRIAVHAAESALSILREHGYLPEEDAFIRSRLAPCGLMCGKCVAFSGGPVQRLSLDLQRELGPNFSGYAQRFEGMNPVFVKYPAFAELLDFLASGSCAGCREQGCLFQACKVAPCAKEHGVTYCFECEEFPCDQHGMPERLAGIWRGNNEKMQTSGADEWFRKLKDKPRYP
jgi:C_GCAxxG_C_C family probable redox protein